MCPEKDAELTQKSYKVRKQNKGERPSQSTDQKSNHVTPPNRLTGHEGSKREKKGGTCTKIKPLLSLNRKEFYKDTQFYPSKSGGANWVRIKNV